MKTRNGITLIETIVYTTLLSLLLMGFISFAYDIHFRNLRISNLIEDAYAE